MKKRTTGALAALLAALLILWALPGQAQPRRSESELAQLSEKDLYKEYERAFKAGQLEDAYATLKAALEKRNAGRSKPKPHKKYTPAFENLKKALADREAAAGLSACERGDLALCQAKLRSATDYASTARTGDLETRFARSLDEIRGRLSAGVEDARKAIAAVDYKRVEEALAKLEGLHAYAAYLPNLDSSIRSLLEEYFRRLVAEGGQQIANRDWDRAEAAFRAAQKLRPDLAEPKLGLDNVAAGRAADGFHARALALAQEGSYAEALHWIGKAQSAYPGGDYLAAARKRIESAWVDFMAPQIPGLAARQTFEGALKASVYLGRIAALDPGNPVLQYRPEVESTFGYGAYDLGLNLSGMIPYMATAYVMLLNAQMRLSSNTVPLASLKSAASDFNRKRASQLLISVENLTAAPESFRDAVAALSSHTVENFALPDLRVRGLDQYYQSPDEDPEFQDLLPDGKSSTCLLRIGISKHLSERWPVSVEEVASGFVSGTESVPNPDYEAKERELVEFRRKLEAVKNDDRRRAQEPMYQLMLEQFRKIERNVTRDKITDYTYKRISYTQQTEVELRINLSDLKTKEVIFDGVIAFSEEQPAVKVEGVHAKDASGARDEALLLPSTEQSLQKGERHVLASLEAKIAEILPLFTHRFFKEGGKLYDLGKRAEAAEQMLCHWAFFRGRLDESQAEFSARVILEEAGFDVERNGAEFLSLVARTAPSVP